MPKAGDAYEFLDAFPRSVFNEFKNILLPTFDTEFTRGRPTFFIAKINSSDI